MKNIEEPLLNTAGKISSQEHDPNQAEVNTTAVIEESLGSTTNKGEVISREFVKDAMLTEAVMPSILPSKRLQDLASLGDRSKDVDRIKSANLGDTTAQQEIETIEAMNLATFHNAAGLYTEAIINYDLKDLFDPVKQPSYSDKPNSIPRMIIWLETVKRVYQRELLKRTSKLSNTDQREEDFQKLRFYSWIANTRRTDKENFRFNTEMLNSAELKDGRFEIPKEMEDEMTERFIQLSNKIINARADYLAFYPTETIKTGTFNRGQQETYFNAIVREALNLNSRDEVPQFIAEQIVSRIKKSEAIDTLKSTMQSLLGFTDEEYKQAETLYQEKMQKEQNLSIQTGVRKKTD